MFWILITGLAVLAASGTGLFAVAIVNGIASFWSNGVLQNFRHDPDQAPTWAALVSAVTTVAAVGLGIAALVIR